LPSRQRPQDTLERQRCERATAWLQLAKRTTTLSVPASQAAARAVAHTPMQSRDPLHARCVSSQERTSPACATLQRVSRHGACGSHSWSQEAPSCRTFRAESASPCSISSGSISVQCGSWNSAARRGGRGAYASKSAPPRSARPRRMTPARKSRQRRSVRSKHIETFRG
jgi:hypothetical protein